MTQTTADRERLHRLAKEFAACGSLREFWNRTPKRVQDWFEAERNYRVNVRYPAVVLDLFDEIERLKKLAGEA